MEFSGELLRPFDPPGQTQWSVGDLNEGNRPWLRGQSSTGAAVEIHAGVGIDEFRRLIGSANGTCS